MGVIIFRRGAARTAREIRVLNEKVANKQNSREFRQKPAAAEDGQGGKGGGEEIEEWKVANTAVLGHTAFYRIRSLIIVVIIGQRI